MTTPQIVYPAPGAANVNATRDATLNDSDKTFTVPDGKLWWLKAVYTSTATTATAGSRVITVNILDAAGNVIYSMANLTAITAGTTGIVRFGIGLPYAASATNAYVPLPDNLYLPDGFAVRVFDANAIDAAADDMTVALLYDEYSIPYGNV